MLSTIDTGKTSWASIVPASDSDRPRFFFLDILVESYERLHGRLSRPRNPWNGQAVRRLAAIFIPLCAGTFRTASLPPLESEAVNWWNRNIS